MTFVALLSLCLPSSFSFPITFSIFFALSLSLPLLALFATEWGFRQWMWLGRGSSASTSLSLLCPSHPLRPSSPWSHALPILSKFHGAELPIRRAPLAHDLFRLQLVKATCCKCALDRIPGKKNAWRIKVANVHVCTCATCWGVETLRTCVRPTYTVCLVFMKAIQNMVAMQIMVLIQCFFWSLAIWLADYNMIRHFCGPKFSKMAMQTGQLEMLIERLNRNAKFPLVAVFEHTPCCFHLELALWYYITGLSVLL